MARKDFQFDFNEDAEPVEELHRLRMAAAKHFKTIEAIVEYDRALPTAGEMIAKLKAEAARSRKTGTVEKTSRQRRTAKRLVHA